MRLELGPSEVIALYDVLRDRLTTIDPDNVHLSRTRDKLKAHMVTAIVMNEELPQRDSVQSDDDDRQKRLEAWLLQEQKKVDHLDRVQFNDEDIEHIVNQHQRWLNDPTRRPL